MSQHNTSHLSALVWGITVTVAMAAIGLAPPAPSSGHAASNAPGSIPLSIPSPCSAIIAQGAPEVISNTSLFLTACEQTSFQQTYAEAGLGNFSTGSYARLNVTPPVLVYFYEFAWVANCSSSFVASSSCFEGAYWAANTTSGIVTGPNFSESPYTPWPSYGGNVEAATLGHPTAPILIFGVSAGLAAGLIGFVLSRRTSERRNS